MRCRSVLLACLGVLAVGLMSGAVAEEVEPRLIHVVGKAELQATADQAIFEVTVATADLDPAVARDQNREKVETLRKVVDDLEAQGTNFATQQYEVSRVNIAAKFEAPQIETRCQRVVIINMREIEKAGPLIDQLVELGHEFEVAWRVDERAELERQALTLALEDAKAKAALGLEVLGEKLGRPQDVQLYTSWGRRGSSGASGGLFGGDDDDRSSSDPGEVWLYATVDVIFEIGE